MSHEKVKHPSELVKQANNWAAFKAATIYGSAATVWVFTLYSILSGLAKGSTQIALLTWSNGVQLVFCAVMTFVGNQIDRHNKAKADADHVAMTHIATTVDDILTAVAREEANA